jgi:hypothetical protein
VAIGTWENVLAWLKSDPHALRPGQLYELFRQMGVLADWWLGPEARQRLRDLCGITLSAPTLPTVAGSGAILFAQEDPPGWPMLGRAFLLPVQWRKGTPTNRRLPRSLQALASRVADTLALPDWGLHLSEPAGLDSIDLSGLDKVLQVDSAWAALAGSLMVAAEGGIPNPNVWATGAWDSNSGIRPVRHLGAKIKLAAEWRVQQLFVPESQVDQAGELARAAGVDLAIGTLYEHRSEPGKALLDYRDALELPPLDDAPREDRRSYYLRLGDDQRARRYYRTHLMPEIVHDLQKQWHNSPGRAATHLVTIVSHNPEVACLTLAMVRPRQALLLCTRDMQRERQQTEQLLATEPLAEHVCRTSREFVEYESSEALVADLPQVVRRFVQGADPEAVVLDLTPGTKEMSLALALEVAQMGNRMCYVRHKLQKSRVVAFTEQLRIYVQR